jgi:hypothetical protein
MSGPAWAEGGAPSTTETPSWLSGKTTDEEAAATASSGNFSTVEINQPDATTTTAAASTSHSEGRCGKIVQCVIYTISTALFAIFIASAVLQDNDSDGLAWRLFYAFHAVTAGLFVVARLCFMATAPCFDKPLTALAICMMIWSIILVAIASKNLANAKSGGSKEGGDSDKFTDKEEKAYEVAGSALGLASVLFHLILWKFSLRKNNTKNNDE